MPAGTEGVGTLGQPQEGLGEEGNWHSGEGRDSHFQPRQRGSKDGQRGGGLFGE